MSIDIILGIVLIAGQALVYIITRAMTFFEPDVEFIDVCNTEADLTEQSIMNSIKVDLKEHEMEELRKALSTPLYRTVDIEQPAVDILGFAYSDVPKTEKADKQSDTYICPCCGTAYIAEGSGFIPNCTNCGARLEKER